MRVGENVHWSFTLIGTPCSGPFRRPVAANSSSSLRASCLASSKNTIRRVRQTRAQHYHYDRVQIVETQAVRTFSEAIHRFLRLRGARNISLQHYRRSPLSGRNILHNLRCCAPQEKFNPQLELAS
jgi:hypothetical protein